MSSYVYLKAILLLQSFVHTIVSQLSTWQFVICSMSSVLEPEGKMYVFHVLHSRMIHLEREKSHALLKYWGYIKIGQIICSSAAVDGGGNT